MAQKPSPPPRAVRPLTTRAAPASLPTKLPRSFARQQLCNSEQTLDQLLPDPNYALTPYEAVPSRTALWVHDFTRECRLTIPLRQRLELVVLSLSGILQYRDVSAAVEASDSLAAWTALHAPGAGLELGCNDETCRVILCLMAPDSTLSDTLLQGSSPDTSRRLGALEVRALPDASRYTWNQNQNHATIVFGGNAESATRNPSVADGSTAVTASDRPRADAPRFSLTLLQGAATVSIPAHTHQHSWENLLVLQGKGALELRGRSYAVVGGEVIHIAPNVRHAYRSAGTEPLVAVQLYSPAGPEQRFIEAARTEAASSQREMDHGHRAPQN